MAWFARTVPVLIFGFDFCWEIGAAERFFYCYKKSEAFQIEMVADRIRSDVVVHSDVLSVVVRGCVFGCAFGCAFGWTYGCAFGCAFGRGFGCAFGCAFGCRLGYAVGCAFGCAVGCVFEIDTSHP